MKMARKYSLLALFLSLGICTQTGFVGGSSSTHSYGDPLPSSCIGLENGDYWLQLSVAEESYNPVYVTCENEYVIIDVMKDADLLSYFTSFELWHYKLAGPANHDPVMWTEWFIPENQENDEYTSQYLISPDCSLCDEDALMQVHDTSTTYWMTGNLAKLHWPVIGFNECDMDWDSYQCYNCNSCMYISAGCEPEAYNETTTNFEKSGICGVTVQESNHIVYKQREKAQSQRKIKNYKPSIGTASEFCVCYRPDESLPSEYYLTDDQENYLEEKVAIMEEFAQNLENSDYVDIDVKSTNPKIRARFQEYLTDNNNNNNGKKLNENFIKNNAKINTKTFSKQERKDETDKIISILDEYDEEDPKAESRNPKIPQFTNDEGNYIDTTIYYISQSDFTSGTYNIRNSGTYIITEDIIFDFNSNDDYWPRSDQSDVYPGADSYRDPYHLGFFAGITVECDNVVIDLNGHKLEQSIEFYYQQRWFAIIELGNQQFLPGQGPAFFGPDPVLIKNIEIRNGILGRTSHFGIHGNFPTNIKFEDLKIEGFVTHGLQLNGWENLEMNNIDVGPSSEIEYLKGDYGHARILAQRLEKLEDELLSTDEFEYTRGDLKGNINLLSEVREELDKQMELALQYALNRVENKFSDTDYIDPNYLITDEDITRWTQAKAQFIHESGYPSASSITGIFLNFEGASVFSYTMYTTHQSKNGRLSNIHIHDISHDMEESMRFGYSGASGQMYPTPWNSDIPIEYSVGGKDKLLEFYQLIYSYEKNITEYEDAMEMIENNFQYQGSIMTDVYFTMATVSDDWDQLGFLEIEETNQNISDVIDWVNGWTSDELLTWRFGCNQDIMGHSGKGLLGIRIDGVNDLILSNIKISDLYEHTNMGSDACGNYVRFTPQSNGGHFKQSSPMQHGFSGNDLQAMSVIASTYVQFKDNIIIKNLKNDYSQAFGLSFWTGNDLSFDENVFVKVTNIESGILIDEWEEKTGQTLTYTSAPNRSPEACAVRLETSQQTSYYDSRITFDSLDSAQNILTCDINGRDMCLGKDTAWSMYGNYLGGDKCQSINSHSELVAYKAEYPDEDNVDFDTKSDSNSDSDSSDNAEEDVVIVVGNVDDDLDIVGIEHVAGDDDDNKEDVNPDVVIGDGNEINSDSGTDSDTKEKGYRISGVIIFLIIAISIGTMLAVHFVRTKCCTRYTSRSSNYTLLPNNEQIVPTDYGTIVVE